MPSPAQRPWPRFKDALLTTEPSLRLRLSQAGLAMALMAAGVLTMHYFVWVGLAPGGPVWAWTAASLGGMALFFVLIRCRWSRRCADPSLTLPQMIYALSSAAVAYALLGPGRGGVLPVLMVVLAFGMFQLRPVGVRVVSLFSVALFGAVMALMAWRRPEVYVPRVEFGHFLMVATMLPAMSVLASRLSRLRGRLHERQERLTEALARIQELATRDELTTLVNRRHMLTLMEQERQRCVRSGHAFCLAMMDIDHFKRVNDQHGHGAGDSVLRSLARRVQGGMRVSDTLARWGGEEFVLLLTESRAALARGGVERLRERVAQQPFDAAGHALTITVSFGLAEHRAGETVAQTLERADRALYEAKAKGRNRVVLA